MRDVTRSMPLRSRGRVLRRVKTISGSGVAGNDATGSYASAQHARQNSTGRSAGRRRRDRINIGKSNKEAAMGDGHLSNCLAVCVCVCLRRNQPHDSTSIGHATRRVDTLIARLEVAPSTSSSPPQIETFSNKTSANDRTRSAASWPAAAQRRRAPRRAVPRHATPPLMDNISRPVGQRSTKQRRG